MNVPTLGRTLKTLRTSAGLTLEELASQSGVSRATLAALEGGSNINPRLATLDSIAAPLGLNATALLALSSMVVTPALSCTKTHGANGSPQPSGECVACRTPTSGEGAS
jgi:transcriptional regulator with XRE-family HTH domain